MRVLGSLAVALVAGAVVASCSSGDDGPASEGEPASDELASVRDFLTAQSSASWKIDTESKALWNSLVNEQEGFRIVLPGTRHEVDRSEVIADLDSATGGSQTEYGEWTWDDEPLPHVPFVDNYTSADSVFVRAACTSSDLADAPWASSALADPASERESPQFFSPNWLPAVVALLESPTITAERDEVVLTEVVTVSSDERVGPWPLYGLPPGTEVTFEVTARRSGEVTGVEAFTQGDGLTESEPLEHVTLSNLAWDVDVPAPPEATLDMAAFAAPDCPGEPPAVAIPL